MPLSFLEKTEPPFASIQSETLCWLVDTQNCLVLGTRNLVVCVFGGTWQTLHLNIKISASISLLSTSPFPPLPLLPSSSPSPPLSFFPLLSLSHLLKGMLRMPCLSAMMPTLWPKYEMTSSMNSRCRNNLQLRTPSGWSNSTTRESFAGESRASEDLSGDHEGTVHPDQGRPRPSYRVCVILFRNLRLM